MNWKGSTSIFFGSLVGIAMVQMYITDMEEETQPEKVTAEIQDLIIGTVQTSLYTKEKKLSG